MKAGSRWPTALLASLTSPAVAQLSGWQDNQYNATICTWEQPRAAVIRDTIYLDGGQLWWSPGLNDGRIGSPASEGNFQGTVFTFSLNSTIEKDTNTSALLVKNTESKSRGGRAGASPYFVDGAMLSNDAEFFLFGGAMFRNQRLYESPDADHVDAYQAYQYGDEKSLWQPGFYDRELPDGMNRYIAYGGAASAPSENKAWYFSGLTSPTHGEIYTILNPRNKTDWAQDVSNKLITLDMSKQNDERWTNKTLGNKIDGRANAEVVWVPVGEQGILVVLGGVTYPQWAGTEKSNVSDDEKKSEDESPAFMETIDIYDVANDKWYKQKTKDGPGARTRGCAVVATASDQSSFNIYYYGGFDGIHVKESFSDEVWVLSLPSFTWHKLNEGDEVHARSGHKCFTPYPDQMMAFGGYTPLAGAGTRDCLDKGPIVMFNLSSGEWMDEYNPDKHDDYGVPTKVQDKIGGNAAGGATLTTPSPSGWDSKDLSKVFATSYDMDKIKTWGPFKAEKETSRPELPGDGKKDEDGGGGGLPSWVAPVLGVVLGLVVLTTAIVLFCLWRRRKIFKGRRSSTAGTEDAGMRIMSWMRGQPPPPKAVTVASTEDTPGSPEMAQHHGISSIATTVSPGLSEPLPHHHEVGDTQIAELQDTSPPIELPDNPMSHDDVIAKHSHLGRNMKSPGSFSSPSLGSFSFIAGGDYNSTISRSSAAANSSAPLGISRDTPPHGGSTPDPDQSRVTSGVSGYTESEIGHLRHVSETSIDANLASNAGTGQHAAEPASIAEVTSAAPAAATSSTAASDAAASSAGHPVASARAPAGVAPAETPISPPTAGDTAPEEYASARQQIVSPERKSIFRESEEDMRKD